MKRLILFLTIILALSVQLSAQIIPGKEPTFRFATPEESKALRSADTWKTVAVSSTVTTGCAAAVTFIFFIEKLEAVNRDADKSDVTVYTYAAAFAGAAAAFSTFSWCMYKKKQKQIPANCYVLKTSPKGLVIEF